MNTIDANTSQVLQQIRTLGHELRSSAGTTDVQGAGFGDLLKNSLHAVNDAQSHSKTLKTDFVSGTGEHSLAEVVIASEKAGLGFRAVAEVRNKLVTAYQDIMNMPV